jgi:competence protein ComEA
VFELAAGARVIDAVEAAGGALPDAVLAGVNLARPLMDGEQIVVPDEDSAAAPAAQGASGGAAGGAGPPGAGGPGVNINTADAATLQTLPGVGPATASKIIADREANGPFKTPEDLMRVSGIGEKKLEAIRELISVL